MSEPGGATAARRVHLLRNGISSEDADVSTTEDRACGRLAGPRPLGGPGHAGTFPEPRTKQVLVCPLLLLPPQLLPQPGAQVAQTAGRPLPAAAGLHALPAVQGA